METGIAVKEMGYPIGDPVVSYARRVPKSDCTSSETDRRLNEAQAIARIGSWELDVQTGKITWSSETFRLMDFDPECGEPDLEMVLSHFHPEDRANLRAAVEEVNYSGGSFDLDLRLVRKDGSVRWMQSRGRAVYSQDGTVVRQTGVIQDITERKEAEHIQQHILRSARCILWTSTVKAISPGVMEWQTKSFSEVAAKSFLPLEQLPGESYLDALFRTREIENDFDFIHQHSRECIERNEGYSHTFKVRNSSGRIIWICEDVTVETIHPGQWSLTGVMTDVTEQKEAELLQEHIMRSARCIFWTSDVYHSGAELEWQTRIFSDTAAQSFLPIDQREGESYHQATCRMRDAENEDIAEMHAISDASVRAGKSFSHNYKIRNKQGKTVWLHDEVNVESVSTGHWRATGVTTDITDRMEAQERLQQSAENRKREREFLRSVIDASSDIIFVMDADGTFTLANEAMAKYHQMPVENIIGKRFTDFVIDPTSAAIIHEYKAKALASPGESFFYEQRLEFDRREYWSQAMQRALPSLDGERYEVLLISQDITERKRYEEHLKQINAQLREATREAEMARDVANDANRAKSEFLANMSHEIRTPMNGVLGMTQLLAYTPMTAEQQDYVSTLQQSAEALLVVIDDILNFSKLEAGKFELHPVNYNLPELVTEVMALLEPCANGKGLIAETIISPNVPVPIFGDSVRIRQVLLNLVGNAIKFTETGMVSIRCERLPGPVDEPRIRIEVIDTGIGISKTDQARLFQSFSQVDSSATRRFGGTGLGLAISKQLVELMGGIIGVNSEVGKGSTFWVEVPLVIQDIYECHENV